MSDDNSEQRQLRLKVRHGDHDAFSDLYREHLNAVFALAYRLTGDRSQAEEVAAETFLTAWRSRSSIEIDDRPLLPWLLAIASRQSLNATRSARRRIAFLSRRPAPPIVDNFADEAVARIDDAQLLLRTQHALASLTRNQAEMLSLCVWSGLSYAETAHALDIPIGTVRSRLAAARSRLRALTTDIEQPTSHLTTTPGDRR